MTDNNSTANRPIPSNPDKWRGFLNQKDGVWLSQQDVDTAVAAGAFLSDDQVNKRIAEINTRLAASDKATATLNDGMKQERFSNKQLQQAIVKIAKAELGIGTEHTAEITANKLLADMEAKQSISGIEREY